MGAALAQHVPEQHVLELVGGDRRQLHLGGDGDGLPRGRSVYGSLGGGDVKLRPHLFGDDGIGGGVIPGVLHDARGGVVDGLGGHGLGGKDLGVFHIDPGIFLSAGIFPQREQRVLFQILGGHRQAVLGHGHLQGILRHLIGGVHGLPGKLLRQLGGFLLKNGLLRLRGDPFGAPAAHQAGKIVPPPGKEARLGLGKVKDQLRLGLVVQGIGDPQLPVGDGGGGSFLVDKRPLRSGFSVSGLIRRRQIKVDLLLRQHLAQLLRRLGDGEPAYRHVVDGGVGIKGIQGTGPGAKTHIGGTHHAYEDSYDHQRPFAALFQPGPPGFLHHGLVVLFHDALL